MKRGSYGAQQAARRVSQYTVPALPEPTADVLDAMVYRVAYQRQAATGGGPAFIVVSFDVLAMHLEQAEIFGRLRLVSMRLPVHEFVQTSAVPCPGASVDRIVSVLKIEDIKEGELRRAEWARQQEGPAAS